MFRNKTLVLALFANGVTTRVTTYLCYFQPRSPLLFADYPMYSIVFFEIWKFAIWGPV